MAKKVVGRVKEGYFSIVENTERRRNAAERYLLGWIEDEMDGKEKPLLFTEHEVKVASDRGVVKKGLAPRAGIFSTRADLGHMSYVENYLRKHWNEANGYYFMRMKMPDRRTKVLLAITGSMLESVKERTRRNSEDVVGKGLLTDLFD